jgi:hypothetical protein
VKKYRGSSVWILLFFVSALILHHIFGYIGHYGYDDLEYARLAGNFTHGIIDFNNHYSYRLSLILLTALSYSLFGVSDFASSLPSLIITISILLLVFFTLKNYGNLTLMAGLALTAFSRWFIFYSDKLMPDIYLAFSVTLSLFILHKYKFGSKEQQPVLYSFLFTLSLFFGFLAKETIVLILPLLVYFVITDFINRRDIKFWIYSFISGFIFLFSYFLIIRILTGDFSKRFEAIAQNTYLNLCSYDKQPFRELLKRITYGFFNLLISGEMFIGYIFVIAFLIQKKFKRILNIDNSFSFYLVSAVILILSSNFMSISLTSYSPMCLDPRHYLFLIPIVSIPAAIIITDYVKTKQNDILILITLITVTTIAFLQIKSSWKLYLLLTILFGLYYLIRKNDKFQQVFIFAFVLSLMAVPLNMVRYAKKVHYQKQKEIAYKYFLNRNQNCYIITDAVQKNLGTYYTGFYEKSNCKFINFNEFIPDTLVNEKIFLFLNGYTQKLAGLDYNDLPFYAKIVDPVNVLIYENTDLGVSIYEMNKIKVPSITGTELYNSFNDFEQKVPFWDTNDTNISGETKYEGTNSLKVNEFSSIFSYPLDSLADKEFKYLIISGKLYCNVEQETSSKFIISVEAKDSTYITRSIGINKYLKAYSNWWPVIFEVEINKNDIKDASLLKVYLWNIDRRKTFIDNFSVKLTGIN